MPEPLLQIEGLTKRFGGVIASDGVAVDVAKGELHAVIGPNGAGKTTLIGHDPARPLLPSALAGSELLLAADTAVHIIPSTSDIKVGVLTSIIGVPFFLYLIMRERRALSGGVA